MRGWIVSLVLIGCSPSPPPVAPPAASGEVQLAPPGEPGQALKITGSLIRADDRAPLAGQRLLVYQADTTGEYRASDPDDERTARLRALVTTDAGGHFVLRTILPGAYGDPPGDPHLHVEVIAAQPAMHSVYFAGFVQASTVRWTETTEQGHIAPTTRGDDGALDAELVLPVRGVAR